MGGGSLAATAPMPPCSASSLPSRVNVVTRYCPVCVAIQLAPWHEHDHGGGTQGQGGRVREWWLGTGCMATVGSRAWRSTTHGALHALATCSAAAASDHTRGKWFALTHARRTRRRRCAAGFVTRACAIVGYPPCPAYKIPTSSQLSPQSFDRASASGLRARVDGLYASSNSPVPARRAAGLCIMFLRGLGVRGVACELSLTTAAARTLHLRPCSRRALGPPPRP